MGLDLKSIIPFAIAILYALTIHEFFHAWTANKLGDPTARMQGRLTLNPLAHLDPLGVICFIFAHFGWGKPVPVNPSYFKHPRRDDVLVSAAGPISNFASALLFGLIFQILYKFTGVASDLFEVLKQLIMINLILAVFNCIPFVSFRWFTRSERVFYLDRCCPATKTSVGTVHSFYLGQFYWAILLIYRYCLTLSGRQQYFLRIFL